MVLSICIAIMVDQKMTRMYVCIRVAQGRYFCIEAYLPDLYGFDRKHFRCPTNMLLFNCLTMAESSTGNVPRQFPRWQSSISGSVRQHHAHRPFTALHPRWDTMAPVFAMVAELSIRFAPTAVTLIAVSDHCPALNRKSVTPSSGHGHLAHRKPWTGPLHSTLW